MLGLPRTLVQVAIASVVAAGTALAAPCPSTNDGSLQGSLATFCVDAFGTVDGWFNNSIGETAADNLMGNSALWIAYQYYDTGLSQSRWVTEWLEGGNNGVSGNGTIGVSGLAGSGYTSPFTVDHAINDCSTPGACPGTEQTGAPGADVLNRPETATAHFQSTITDNLGLSIQIDNYLINNSLKQILTITGDSGVNPNFGNLEQWQVAEYFQYFPYGSGHDNSTATLSYTYVPTTEQNYQPGLAAVGNGGYWSAGNACGGFTAGPRYGCAGTAGSGTYAIGAPSDVAAAINGNTDGSGSTYNNAAGPVMYGASAPAGALLWSTTSSSANQVFVLELVPEPGTMTLMILGAGLGFLSLRRRRTA